MLHKPTAVQSGFDVGFCTCCFKRFISAALGSTLTIGLFLILRALSAYRSVLMVSSMFESAGLTHAIIKVWLLPPRESSETNRKQFAKELSKIILQSLLCCIVVALNTCLFGCTLTSNADIFLLNKYKQNHQWTLRSIIIDGTDAGMKNFPLINQSQEKQDAFQILFAPVWRWGWYLRLL